MARHAQRFEIAGSERPPLEGARVLRRLHPEQVLEVSLHLHRREGARLPSLLGLAPHVPLSRDAFARRYGADPRARRRIEAAAARHGLRLVNFSAERRCAVLRGPARALQSAFGVELLHYEHDGGHHHGHAGPVRLPGGLEACVHGVFGLHGRPVARPHVKPHRKTRRRPLPPDIAHYTADEVARLYDFPAAFDGQGQTIGLIQLGGGFHASDLATYFQRLRLPVPAVEVVSVNGARNRPLGRPFSADAEVLLDLEVAGAVAPGARFVLYFAPCDDRGFLDAVKHAVHDRARSLSVLSMSWGHPETEWSANARHAMNDVFHEAATLGLTVCASAGDEGASAGLRTGLTVEFPASSPYVLACGGTRLLATRGRIAQEVVWNDLAEGFGATGGGVSAAFPRPAYQRGVSLPVAPSPRRGRGVPDVAGNADPETGYRVRVDGRWLRLGGTSAVAPLWAALVARLNQGLGRRLGFLVPRLYAQQGSAAFRPIVSGNNGGYDAGPGWNACTGLGSPHGTRLFERLRDALAARVRTPRRSRSAAA